MYWHWFGASCYMENNFSMTVIILWKMDIFYFTTGEFEHQRVNNYFCLCEIKCGKKIASLWRRRFCLLGRKCHDLTSAEKVILFSTVIPFVGFVTGMWCHNACWLSRCQYINLTYLRKTWMNVFCKKSYFNSSMSLLMSLFDAKSHCYIVFV